MNDRDHLEAVFVELRDEELAEVSGGWFNFGSGGGARASGDAVAINVTPPQDNSYINRL
jgi:lactobin A/cerein 7B family class IIb bacteriocin